MTTFDRIRLLVAAGKTTIPLVLPDAVFNSTRLLSPDNTPIPKSVAVPVAYPFPLVSFNLNELLDPWIHMPPQGFAADPFLTDTLFSTLIPEEVGFTRIPERQLVVVVTPCTQPFAVAMNRMPSPWNCRTTPGPRMPTSL